MKKLKDLIYDYNDILLAIIIIIVAGAVIFWKVSDIMAYPTFAKNQQEQQSQDVDMTDVDLDPVDVDPIVAPGDDINGEGEGSGEGSGENQQNTNDDNTTSAIGGSTQGSVGVKSDTKFTVPSGYVSSKIATKLEDEGLCTKDDFLAAVKSLNAEKKLRAGDFNIPAGSTPEDIVKIIGNIK